MRRWPRSSRCAGHLAGGGIVVDADGGRGAQIVLGRDAHDGNRRLLQFAEHDRVIAQRRQQDHPLQAQLADERVDLLLDVGALDVQRLDHQVHARLPATFDRAGLKFTQIVPGPVAEQADQKRPIAGKSSGIEVRAVVELVDRLQNAGPRVGAHPRLVIDHPRYGLRRYPGEVGHLLNGHRGGDESHGTFLKLRGSRYGSRPAPAARGALERAVQGHLHPRCRRADAI